MMFRKLEDGMKRSDAKFFAEQIEDFLEIPPIVSETIKDQLVNGDYKDVCRFILGRRKVLEGRMMGSHTIETLTNIKKAISELAWSPEEGLDDYQQGYNGAIHAAVKYIKEAIKKEESNEID